jgi:hypothetical protein
VSGAAAPPQGTAAVLTARGPASQVNSRGGLTTVRNPNAAPASWASFPTTLRPSGWWARCYWSRTSTGSSRAGGCSQPRAWPRSQPLRIYRRRPACRKQPAEPRPQVSGGAASLWGAPQRHSASVNLRGGQHQRIRRS